MANTPPGALDVSNRRAQMFPALTEMQIARIAKVGSETKYAKGDLLFDAGDLSACHVILDGEVEIVHPRGTLEDPVTVHKHGEFTGEASLLSDRRTLVRARAITPVRTLLVPRAEFHKLIQGDAEISEIFMRAFILRRMGLLAGGLGDVVAIGSRHSAATVRLQEFLVRNGHPYRYLDVDRDAEVQSLLDSFHVTVSDVPVLISCSGSVLKNPSNAEVAESLGFNAALEPTTVYDVIVCGAGPGGLAAAVYAASEGLDVLVLEDNAPGGQAGASSKIENYLGFPTGVSGQALAARSLAQAEKFGAKVVVARGAKRLHCEEVPFRVEMTNGDSIRAKSIIVATGAAYRKLEVPDLKRFEGVGVYYGATYVEAQRCEAEVVAVVGGGNSAGQAATFLASTSHHVHVFIRGEGLAATMSRYLIQRIEETPNITLHRRTRVVALDGAEQLESVTWSDDATGTQTTQPIRHLFSMIGARPNTEWLTGCLVMDRNGFVCTGPELSREMLDATGWSLTRQPYLFETSQAKVFAVGDVRATSVKRVASAVGEGSVCVQLVHKVLAE